MTVAACTCCKGKGQVLSIEGALRPCSRCRRAAFLLWCRARRDGHVTRLVQKQDQQTP